jgi:uncharacterized FlaG/YvyC family protein
MVITVVGINSINISAGVKDVVVTPPETKSTPKNSPAGATAPVTVTAATGAENIGASSKLEPISSNVNSAMREVMIEDNVVLRISYDDDSGRFIYSGVDKLTGDVVRQYPPEGVLKLLAQNKIEAAGLILDEET